MMEATDTRSPRLIVLLLIAVALCPFAHARTVRVDEDGPADYATIQAAIDTAVDGDVILVAPGTYTGDGNRDIDFKGKAITVRSEAGPATCIIHCDGSPDRPHRGFLFCTGEDANSVLDGLTVQGGRVQSSPGGGGIRCDGGSPVIRNCILRGNIASVGGGISLVSSDALVLNCIIFSNRADYGGGVECFGSDTRRTVTTVVNCTIQGNWGGGVRCWGGSQESIARFVNCIMVNNQAGGRGDQVHAASGNAATISRLRTEIVWSCIQSASCTDIWQDGCDGIPPESPSLKLEHILYLADPLFAKPGYWSRKGLPSYVLEEFWVDGDCHLKSQAGRWDPYPGRWVTDDVTSPCIDAGDPNSPVGSELFPNGGQVNMGAYGGTAEASRSPSGAHAKYGGGAGEPENPHLIYTAEHISQLGAEPGDWGKSFRLMADIDLSGDAGGQLDVIGAGVESPFAGVFDGDGHRISGFVGSGRVGLFGYVSGTIKNVGLTGPEVEAGFGYYVGSLVGDNYGMVVNCYVEDANVAAGSWYGGGLVGRNKGTVADCRSTGTVSGRSAGGLVGLNNGAITGCSSVATVAGDDKVGGLAGEDSYGTVTNSFSTGIVAGDDQTGGLIGYASHSTIASSYSAATVTGNDGVGGLVGENSDGVITNCYSSAEVVGDRMTGGLVGSNGGGTIRNCYATGRVSGRWPAGGLVSFRYDDDTITGSFWDTETTACSWSAGGTGLTTVEMQTALIFLNAGWDFASETANGAEDIWRISEGQDYPRLFWESHGP